MMTSRPSVPRMVAVRPSHWLGSGTVVEVVVVEVVVVEVVLVEVVLVEVVLVEVVVKTTFGPMTLQRDWLMMMSPLPTGGNTRM